jgi:polynucleotide 5'-kinase involved in rRNA processing
MGCTLLIGTRKTTWREWLKSNLGDRDLLLLDPADADHGTPARVSLFRGEKCLGWRFVGSLDATRNPIALMQGVASLSLQAKDGFVVQLFDYRHQPVARQLSHAIAQMLRPDHILAAAGAGIPLDGWPVGPQEVEIEAAFPNMVIGAQRQANWMKLLETAQDHLVEIDRVSIEGTRFGSGVRIKLETLASIGIEGLLAAEVCGHTLVLIVRKEPEEEQVFRALNTAHANKALMVQPQAFSGRLCSFARQSGEDFGMGVIEEADFVDRVLKVRCNAVAPAPVRVLRVGTLKIDDLGREQGDDRPWTV